MNNKTQTPEQKSATGVRFTQADLEATLTVGTALGMADDVADHVADHIEGLIEHWTDEEGLHWLPFQEELKKSLPLVTAQAAMSSLSAERVI